jgi:hypothetical protein
MNTLFSGGRSGTHGKHDRAASGFDGCRLSGFHAEPRSRSGMKHCDRWRLDRVQRGRTAGHRAQVPVFDLTAGDRRLRIPGIRGLGSGVG